MTITRCVSLKKFQSSHRHDNVPDIIVSKIVLSEGDVGGHHGAHPAGHHPVLVEDDAGGHHQPSVGEEASVVDIENLA